VLLGVKTETASNKKFYDGQSRRRPPPPKKKVSVNFSHVPLSSLDFLTFEDGANRLL
jgi:hypothetical protein